MSLTEDLASRIRAAGLTLATAESCTGGLIGHLITDTPGSSRWFRGGLIAYSNMAKTEILGVDAGLIEAHGAVSPEVAEAMARRARERFGADLAVSTTGIAGPTGGTPEKPVGLVYLGLASAGGLRSERFVWPFNRQGNKEASAEQALQMLIDQLLKDAQG